MKSLKEMFGDKTLPWEAPANKRQSSKIKNQNGVSGDEADFIDKQISDAPPMDKGGHVLANDQAAKGNIQTNTLKGKNPDSPDGVYEEVSDEFLDQLYEGAEYLPDFDLNEASDIQTMTDLHSHFAYEQHMKEREAYNKSKELAQKHPKAAKLWGQLQDAHLAAAKHHDDLARYWKGDKK